MKNGVRLPREVALSSPRLGFLIFGERRGRGPTKHAYLLDAPAGAQLMLLEHAHVIKVTNGIRFNGLESYGRTVRSQAWWVVPDQSPLA